MEALRQPNPIKIHAPSDKGYVTSSHTLEQCTGQGVTWQLMAWTLESAKSTAVLH